MQKIHPKSDIKFRINFRESGHNSIPSFEFRYYTTDKNRFITASFDGSNYLNCQPCEGGVLAYWDSPDFYPSILKVLRRFPQVDDRFEDNRFDFIRAEMTNIEISDAYDSNNYSADIVEEVVALSGESAFDSACRGGYTSSAEQFYSDLAQIADFSTKAEVASTLNGKVDKENGKSLVSDAEKSLWNSKATLSYVDSTINNTVFGTKNYIAKRYLINWNNIAPGVVTQGVDNDGTYISILHTLFYNNIVGRDSFNDIFGGAIKFKPNTQYTFSVRWKLPQVIVANVRGFIFIIFYTDGTRQELTIIKNPDNAVIQYMVSHQGKTISKICGMFGSGNSTNIYDIQLTEGNRLTDFMVAEEDIVKDYSMANTEMVLIGEKWLSRDRSTSKQLYAMTIKGTTSAVNISSPLGLTVDSLYSVNGLVFDTVYGTPNDGSWVVRANSNGLLHLTVKESVLASKPFMVTVKYTK